MLREIVAFLKMLSSSWLTLMSGIASVILAAIPELFANTPGGAFFIAAGACLVVAAFRIWRVEYRKVRAYQKTAESRNAVGGLMREGAALIDRLHTSRGEVRHQGSNPEPCQEDFLVVNEWLAKVEGFVAAHYLWFLGQYLSNAGLLIATSPFRSKGNGFDRLYEAVEFRSNRLAELLRHIGGVQEQQSGLH